MPLNEMLAAGGLFAIGVVFVLLIAVAVLVDEDPPSYELLPPLLKMGNQALSGTRAFGDGDERIPDEVSGDGCLRWSGSWNGHERERAECSRAELQGRPQRLQSDLRRREFPGDRGNAREGRQRQAARSPAAGRRL
jgi:hypothetical protein